MAVEFVSRSMNVKSNINPDLLIIEPLQEEKNGKLRKLAIGINDIKKVVHNIHLTPYASPYKVAIVCNAENMTEEAGNCLLKTLEEPMGKALIILTTSNIYNMLPTIVSRCQVVKFKLVSEDVILKGLKEYGNLKFTQEDLIKAVKFSNGRPGLALKYIKDANLIKKEMAIIGELESLLKANINDRYKYVEALSKDAESACRVIGRWKLYFRDLLLKRIGYEFESIYPGTLKFKDVYTTGEIKDIICSIEKTERLLKNPSINSRLALEVMMLHL